ncbi:hypothetical protein WISP_89164 [Willisornis vidua]|uniref:Nudix hydrolase domain-containing protein n=1 Tax=Willisornis vidua TaxID=1566151 RepID=A0ABQ9D7V1_9PASS|nr:hypothetical protein WISP_89164 [Willisornis vidua]
MSTSIAVLQDEALGSTFCWWVKELGDSQLKRGDGFSIPGGFETEIGRGTECHDLVKGLELDQGLDSMISEVFSNPVDSMFYDQVEQRMELMAAKGVVSVEPICWVLPTLQLLKVLPRSLERCKLGLVPVREVEKLIKGNRFPPSCSGSWEAVASGICLEKNDSGLKVCPAGNASGLSGLRIRKDRNPTVEKYSPQGKVYGVIVSCETSGLQLMASTMSTAVS